jgi:hypothetical protein
MTERNPTPMGWHKVQRIVVSVKCEYGGTVPNLISALINQVIP